MQWNKIDYKQILNDRRMILLFGMVILCLAYIILQKHLNAKVEKKLDHTISGIRSYADINYQEVFVDPLSRKVHIKHITITPKSSLESLNIGELIIYHCDTQQRIPRLLHFAIKDFKISSDNINLLKLKPWFNELGYRELSVDFDLKYSLEAKNESFVINRMVISAENAGRAEFYLKLTRVNLIRILNASDSPENLSRILPFVSVSEASLDYSDDSFALRLFKLLAGRKNKQVGYLIHDISEDIQKKTEEADDFTRQQLKALTAFINNPDKIKMIASPAKPVPAANFLWTRDLSGLINLLQIHIQTGSTDN